MTVEASGSNNSGNETTKKQKVKKNVIGNNAVGMYSNTIMSFNALINSAAFIAGMKDGSMQGELSIHDYLTTQLAKVHHELFYIPTAHTAQCIVVKPELLFMRPPRCNVVLPIFKNAISFARNYREEPTRLVVASDPLSMIQGGRQGFNLYSFATITSEIVHPSSSTYDIPVWNKKFINPAIEATWQGCTPITSNCTDFEYFNYIKTAKVSSGSDLALYWLANGDDPSATSNSNDPDASGPATSDSEKAEGRAAYATQESTSTMKYMAKYAIYELARRHLAPRQGSCSMYFNPYIVPGYPFVSLEKTALKTANTPKMALNVYGYVTNVVHNLSDREWSTSISFNCARMENESAPEPLPVIEDSYLDGNLNDRYQEVLGPTALPINITDMEAYKEALNNNLYSTVTAGMAEVWREIYSLDDWCKEIADGATISVGDLGTTAIKTSDLSTVTSEDIICINNNPAITNDKQKFFDTDLQKRILLYSKQVMKDRRAFSIEEVN